MGKFKVHIVQGKTRKIKEVRLIPPNDRTYEAVQNPDKPHEWETEISELALVPADVSERMTKLIGIIKSKWLKEELPLFLEYLSTTGEIRVKHVFARFKSIMSKSEVATMLSEMAKYNALTPWHFGSFKRSTEFNDWLQNHPLLVDSMGKTAPAVSLDRIHAHKQREQFRKKSSDEIEAMTKDELYEYIQIRKEAKAKDSEIEKLNRKFQRLRDLEPASDSFDGL